MPHAVSSDFMAPPVMMSTVRPGMSATRYIAVSVLPLPRFKWRPAARNRSIVLRTTSAPVFSIKSALSPTIAPLMPG